jgi:hypothetical protein
MGARLKVEKVERGTGRKGERSKGGKGKWVSTRFGDDIKTGQADMVLE